MLNPKTNLRELAYLVKIDKIEPIEGSDNCEAAYVGGWHIMVRKETFKAGDLAIYFEIDSRLDTNKPEFAFLEKKHGAIKTQKYTFGGKGNFVSQGLLMSTADFGWDVVEDSGKVIVIDKESFSHNIEDNSRFLTEKLGVTYYVPEDNSRKGKGPDKYEKMYLAHKKLFRNKFIKWLYSKDWGKKVLFVFLGRKVKKVSDFPSFVKKTDEERAQNLPNLFPGDATEWIATEKIDGTSTTFAVKGFGRKRQFYICSRNVVFNNPSKEDRNFYKDTDGNVYLEMAEKYNVKEVMGKILDELHGKNNKVEFLTVQGETFGGTIQKRGYSTTEHDIRVFNIIIGYNDGSTKRLNPIDGTEFANTLLNMPYVPIVDEHFKIPETCDDLLALAGGASQIDGQMREGLVFRTYDGVRSFKAVDNEFLLKFHN